jgi:hypothetical protein
MQPQADGGSIRIRSVATIWLIVGRQTSYSLFRRRPITERLARGVSKGQPRLSSGFKEYLAMMLQIITRRFN